MQDCEGYQPCRKFIPKKLAIHLILDIKTVKTGEVKIKLCFKQIDPIMTKQQSVGLRIKKKTFPNEEIIENFYVKKFKYMTDFYLPKRKLAIEVDEHSHKDRKPEKEKTRQKDIEECLGCTFIRINPDEKDFSAYDGPGKIQTFIDKSKDEELEKLKDKIKELKKYKKSLIDNLSKRLLELEFKQHNAIKSKCLKWVAKNILPNYKK